MSARLTAAIALVLVAMAGCSDDGEDGAAETVTEQPSPSSTASSPSVSSDGSWTLGLDSQPTRAAVSDERIFVSSAGSARFPPQIYAIDTVTGREIAHHTATGQPYDLLLAPDGRLWIAGDRHPDQAGGAGINVHDPESLNVVAHTDLPGQAYALAQVGGEIWVGSDNAVLVLDPDSLDLVRTIPVGGPAYLLVGLPGGGGVVAVEGDRLELIQPDGTVRAAQTIEADGNIVATASESTLWVRVPVGADSTILELDPALGAAAQPVGIDTDSTGGGLLVDATGNVVLVDDRRDEVLCLPGGEPPAVHIPADDLVGVLSELEDGRLLFAASSAVAAREISC